MFVDELTVKLMAGSGGDGCTSFRRKNLFRWEDLMGEMVVVVQVLFLRLIKI